ncbi:MAG: cation diffusion facilitator family transporter [Gammaproteobacteria bacterium]|nr:cation diffusion facilitator family transporter [Gammaproteobacteria bacterium]
MAGGSKKAVVAAILGNAVVTVCKFVAAATTNSASMMNEAVHSMMDTFNQIFLFLGLIQGDRPADDTYAFGHGQKKYLWNLWSAIGLFSIGSGLGLAHAWHAYHKLGDVGMSSTVTLAGVTIDSVWISVVVLTFAFVLEGFVLAMATREIIVRMRQENHNRFIAYVVRCDDPTLTAVFLEDIVAVTGVLFAAIGIGLTVWLHDPIWDITFSVLIALMLGVVAFFLGAVNMRYLTDVRDEKAEEAFCRVVARHPDIERFHDLRSIIVDNTNTVLVAEIELSEQA